MTISEEHKQYIVNDGIAFMRSITECYGTDTGLKLWDRICEVLDPDVHGEIFLAMLSGENLPGRLKISGIVVDRVRAIKAIREVTGLGLKEAKDMNDLTQLGNTVTLEIKSSLTRKYAAEVLRDAGLNVN